MIKIQNREMIFDNVLLAALLLFDMIIQVTFEIFEIIITIMSTFLYISM